MDVDLSTDLRGLLPLVAPLISGHSDVAIGTWLARSACVTRGSKREFISRAYNVLLRTFLRAHFSEEQIVELGSYCAFCVGFGRLGATWNMIEELPTRFHEGEVAIVIGRRFLGERQELRAVPADLRIVDLADAFRRRVARRGRRGRDDLVGTRSLGGGTVGAGDLGRSRCRN